LSVLLLRGITSAVQHYSDSSVEERYANVEGLRLTSERESDFGSAKFSPFPVNSLPTASALSPEWLEWPCCFVEGVMVKSQDLDAWARGGVFDFVIEAFSFKACEAELLRVLRYLEEYVFCSLRLPAEGCNGFLKAAGVWEMRDSPEVGAVGGERSLPNDNGVEIYSDQLQPLSAIISRMWEGARKGDETLTIGMEVAFQENEIGCERFGQWRS